MDQIFLDFFWCGLKGMAKCDFRMHILTMQETKETYVTDHDDYEN